MTPTGPAASAVGTDVSSATSLESDLGQMFGDFTTSGGESPEPESTSAAGTTPAEPATGTENETETPAAASGDGAEPGESAETTSDTPPVDAAAETDLFADTTPATFMVNGKPFTSEDIRVFKEGGAVIRPEALPNVLNKLSERESLFERNRHQSVEYQTLAKATEWTDSAGKTFTGPDAAIEMRIGNASLFAENKLLVDTLMDPDKLYAILATEQVPDGKGGFRERIVVDPTALSHLQTQNELAQVKIAAQIREHYKGVLAQAAQPTADTIDYTAEAPRLIDAIATAAKLDASVLTPQDRTLLAKQLPRHVEKGRASIEWQELVRERIELRTQHKKDAAQIVSVTSKATKYAQNRMAAAARGVKPVAKTATPAPKPPTVKEQRAEDEGALFDAMLSSGAAAMRAAR